MKKFVLPPLLLLGSLLLAGCPGLAMFTPSASGQQQSQQLQTSTQVQLTGQNYRIVKTNVTGTDWGFSLLGFISLASPNYVKAVKELYKDGGMVPGRALSIANVAQQDTAPYFILFSIPRITIRADIIEFLGPALPPPPLPQQQLPPPAAPPQPGGRQ